MHAEILQIGHPVLRQVARKLTAAEIVSAPIQELIQQMKTIMHAAPGVGLAAPQIGHSLQIAVIEDRAEYTKNAPRELLIQQERAPTPFYVIINPVLQLAEPVEMKCFFEGCLSVAGFGGVVSRALAVTVTCLNERAEPITIQARGWFARILQHEIDHLHGKLCIDRTDMNTFMTVENYLQYWRDLSLKDSSLKQVMHNVIQEA